MTTTIRLEPELAERYKRLAAGTGRTQSYYIRQALENEIDELEWEFGILADVEAYRRGDLKTYSIEEVREELGLEA